MVKRRRRTVAIDGQTVWIAQPVKRSKNDYNDVLKNQGLEAVQSNVEKAISYTHFKDSTATQASLKSEVLEKENGVLSPLLSPKIATDLISHTN